MVQRIVKKHSAVSLRGATTPDPPSPTLSGVPTPVQKFKLASSSAVNSASSSFLTSKISDKEPNKSQMKDEEEDLTQSRWFVRTWPFSVRSTPVTAVASQTTRHESHTQSLEQGVPTGDAYSGELNRTLADTPTVTEALTHPPGNLDPSPPIIQFPVVPTDTTNTNTDNAEQGASPRENPNTQQGWVGWLWYGSQHITVPTPALVHGDPQETVSITPSQPPEQELSTCIVSPTYANISTIAPSEFNPENESENEPEPIPPVSSSWFGLWGGNSIPQSVTAKVMNTQGKPPSDTNSVTTTSKPVPPIQGIEGEASEVVNILPNVVESTTVPVNDVQTPKQPVAMTRGWGFWYRSGEGKTASFSSKSSTAPFCEASESASAQQIGGENSAVVGEGPPQLQGCQLVDSKPVTTLSISPQDKPRKNKNDAEISVSSETIPPTAPVSLAMSKRQRICPPNHIFPNFDSCYNILETPSICCTLTRLFKKPLEVPKNHLYRIRTPRQVKKAVAIGVHGFFPMRIVRTVLGEPTGTSVRFAQSAAAAIKRWAETNGTEVEVETVALEGEGKVADRVDMLWKLLEKWVDHVKTADFIVIGAHSQGVVVGLQLLARMIEQGWVDNARVGVAAMAGINLGPFSHLRASILTGSAKELFEFQSTESVVSKKYIQALRTVLAHDVRIVFVGSIDDQLVPLESSTFSNIHHPYIYRAVFVDGRVHAPNFLSYLVGLAMKLRNLGISDHGLIRQLSIPLAGSLYGGEGHSRLYDDDSVYDLAVRHALETTDCSGVPLRVSPYEIPAANNNPFFLPWSMRGLLEEPFVRSKLGAETQELLQQFEDWKPTSKVLKDVKFRLEGIRSEL